MNDTEIHRAIVDSIGTVNSILDVGCSDGSLIRWLARHVAREAIGIDVDGGRFPKGYIWVDTPDGIHGAVCLRCNVYSLRIFPDERFDAIVTVRTLHELKQPQIALLEMRRVLRQKGCLLVADFSREKLDDSEGYYTSEAVALLLEKAGFRRVSSEKVPDDNFLFAIGWKPEAISVI